MRFFIAVTLSKAVLLFSKKSKKGTVKSRIDEYSLLFLMIGIVVIVGTVKLNRKDYDVFKLRNP
ncbi:MAG: hypothetical protein JWP37_3575 [Mucilaginibacter sp.]|nr:hypothetical protein [Mucilaginibacter sp.]